MKLSYWVDEKTGTYGMLDDIRIVELDEANLEVVTAFEDGSDKMRCDFAKTFGEKVNTFSFRFRRWEKKLMRKWNGLVN